MQKTIILAVSVALMSGLAIGVQSSLIGTAGKDTGAVLTGLIVNFSGGAVAGLVLLAIYLRQGSGSFSAINIPTFVLIFIAGVLGLGVIIGLAYALPKTGIAAGLAAIIAGQMLVAVLVDTLGLTGEAPIPLNWTRIVGLVLLVLGTWAILPKE